MKLTVTGRHLTVTDATRKDITRKLSRLERLLHDSAVSAQCILSLEGSTVVCELTVHARGDHMLHGVGRHAKTKAAVTAATDKVVQQAQRLKDRWTSRRRQATKIPAVPAAPVDGRTPPPEREPAPARVIRTRARAARPMSVDDAILALGEADRPFLVFREANTESVVVLYKRPDGHFGLIDTEA